MSSVNYMASPYSLINMTGPVTHAHLSSLKAPPNPSGLGYPPEHPFVLSFNLPATGKNYLISLRCLIGMGLLTLKASTISAEHEIIFLKATPDTINIFKSFFFP